MNGVSESFEATSTFMDFTNLLLMLQNNSNVHIIFKSGISVTVIPNDNSLSFEISISEKFKGSLSTCYNFEYSLFSSFCAVVEVISGLLVL